MNNWKRKGLDECSDESAYFENQFEILFAAGSDKPEFNRLVEDISLWLQNVSGQGCFIPPGSADRRAFRSLLDRWNSLLRRHGLHVEDIDALADFDPTAGIVLTGDCPYPGLDPYTETWRSSFFGREALVSDSIERLERQGNRILFIIGASGSGKSSLALAGILPRMMELHKGAWFFSRRHTPGAHPMGELAESVALAIGHPEKSCQIESILAVKPDEALTQLAVLCQDKPLMLIIDQFEELLTMCRDAGERSTYAKVLESLSDPTASAEAFCCRILLTLRTDHLARFENSDELKSLYVRLTGENNALQLPKISPIDIKRAITEPAERVGLHFVPATLIDQLANQTAALLNGLPLLQFSLRRLWDTRPTNEVGDPLDMITAKMVDDLPDVERALGKVADNLFVNFTSTQKQVCKRLFLELVVLDENFEEPLRRRRNEMKLREVLLKQFEKNNNEIVDDVNRVIGDFLKANLLRRFGKVPFYQIEVAHEALLRHWKEISMLLEGADIKERLHHIKQIGREAHDWAGATPEKKEDYLKLKGELLLKANTYVDEGWLAEGELTAYIDACQSQEEARCLNEQRAKEEKERADAAEKMREAAERARQEQVRLTHIKQQQLDKERRYKFCLIVAFIAALLLAIWAVCASRNADKRLKESEALKMAAASINILNTDPELGLLLALQAASLSKATGKIIPHDVENALHRSVQASRLFRTLSYGPNYVPLQDIHVSPDGTKAVTAGEDNTIMIWNLRKGIVDYVLTGQKGNVKSVAFSPDSKIIATADKESLKLWNAANGKYIRHLPIGKSAFVSFSPKGRYLVTSGGNGCATIWDYQSRKIFNILKYKYKSDCAAFSDDGKYIATGENSYDKDLNSKCMVVVWDTHTGKRIDQLESDKFINAIAFSIDKKYIALARGQEASVWEWQSNRRLMKLRGHTNSINKIIFLSNELIATASNDQTVKIWYAPSEMELMTIQGHKGKVTGVAFNPIEEKVLTSSTDGTVKEWYIEMQPEYSPAAVHKSAIDRLAISPDGQRLVSISHDIGSGNSKVMISDIRGGFLQEPIVLSGFKGTVYSCIFSPDSKLIVTAHEDNKVRIWNSFTGRLYKELDEHKKEVLAVAFNQKGDHIASISSDGIVKKWDIISWKSTTSSIPVSFTEIKVRKLFYLIGLLTEISYPAVPPIAFDPELTLICVDDIGTEKYLPIYNIVAGTKITTISKREQQVLSIAFSNDGNLFLTAGSDNTATVWNTHTGKEKFTLHGHRNAITCATFSSDDKRIATASLDKTVRVWETATGQLMYTLQGHLSEISAVAFSPDGKLTVTGDMGGFTNLYAQSADQLLSLARTKVTRAMNEEECEQFIAKGKKCPSSVKAIDFYVKGKESARSGDFQQAMINFHKSKQLDKAVMSFDTTMEATELANARAEDLIKKKRYDEAITILEKAAKHNLADDRTYFLLGRSYYFQKSWDNAIVNFKKVGKKCFDYAFSLLHLGEIYNENLGRYKDSYQTYLIIYNLNPTDVKTHMCLAEASLLSERWDEARTRAQKIMKDYEVPNLSLDMILTMKFIVVASYILQGKDDDAKRGIQEFINSYKSFCEGYKYNNQSSNWIYNGTRNFVKGYKMDENRRRLLLRMVSILEKPDPYVTEEELLGYLK